MTFGHRVAAVRKQRNLTQKDFGATLGIVQDVVSKYERDQMVPSIETAAKFAKALNVSLDYLILGDALPPADGEDAYLQIARRLEKLSPENREHIIAVIEAFSAKQKIQELFQ